jgi:predicted secreted hydrolase
MLPDGRTRSLNVERSQFRALEHWTSPTTGVRYPIAWQIDLPEEGLRVLTRALVDAQEIDARRSVGFPYWEGLSTATFVRQEISLDAIGYVELTGY